MWLHHTHPQATAGQLTQLRIVLVSNGSLGYLAITKLQLQKYILRNSPALEKRFVEACELADPIFSEHPYYRAVFMWYVSTFDLVGQLLIDGFRDPVKVLCDVFGQYPQKTFLQMYLLVGCHTESLIGAMIVRLYPEISRFS